MKFGFFSKFDYNFIEGKGLLIAVIISFSSISFIIGFFAGKKFSGGEIPQSAKKIGSFVVTEVKTLKETVPGTIPEAEVTGRDNWDKEQEHGAPLGAKTQQQKKAVTDKPPAVEKNIAEPETAETVVYNREAELKPVQQKPAAKERKVVKAETKPEPKSVVKKLAQAKARPVEEKPAKKADDGHGQRYYIQVGAFKNAEEATKVQSDLRKKGFEASILKTQIKDGVTLFKVRVGDYHSQAEANAVLGRLSKKGFKCFMRGEPR